MSEVATWQLDAHTKNSILLHLQLRFADEETYPYLLRFEPDSATSQLYQALAPANGNYEMEVILGSDLTCDGLECELDTVRMVKIGNVYYEFVEQPCVQMVFFDDGKQIYNREN